MVLTVVRVSTFIDQRNGNVKSALGRSAKDSDDDVDERIALA
jgi:hypothetical protein